jgi:Na+/melibiose symporter-like transporter
LREPIPSPEPGASPPLSRAVLVTYALPSIGMHFSFLLMGLYFFKFATDVLLVAPAAMGGLVAVGRLWDGASDPIAGYLSDRTRSRLGRRRSWLAFSVLPFALSVLMLWSPPTDMPGAWSTVWVGGGLLLFYTTYTALAVPYGALGAELSQDYHDRTRVFAYRQGVGSIGLLCAVGAYYLLLEAAQGRGFSSRAVGLGVGSFAAVTLCVTVALVVWRLREREEYQHRGPARVFGAFGDVARNPHARRLLVVQCAHFFSVAALSLVSAFMFQYVLELPSWAATLLVACFAGGTVLAIPAWVSLSRRFGKDRCWRFALFAVGTFYTVLFFAVGRFSAESPLLVAIAAFWSVVLGALQSSNFVLSHSMQADVIDFDEVMTGERKEGAYLATWSFTEKCAAALAAMTIGLTLEAVDYTPGGKQTESARTAILALMSLLPAACHFLAALALRGYGLDEAEHARIRAVLRARPRAHSGGIDG